jgi:acyl-CoA thioesterase-1
MVPLHIATAIGCIVIAAASPFGAAAAPTLAEATADARPKLVAFGNSLTSGLGVSAEDAYPAQLQRRLDEAGFRYRVINAGVSGDTTAGGLRRVRWILNSKPTLVILELGGNDGLRGLSLAETKRNLEQIIEQLQQASVTVVLAGMKLPPNYGQEYTQGFEEIYPALARRYRLRRNRVQPGGRHSPHGRRLPYHRGQPGRIAEARAEEIAGVWNRIRVGGAKRTPTGDRRAGRPLRRGQTLVSSFSGTYRKPRKQGRFRSTRNTYR